MAIITQLDTRLITRHDTEANWLKNDPTLMPGEIAITDPEVTSDGSYTLPKFKVGFDATKHWSEIEYCLDTNDLLGKIKNLEESRYITSSSEEFNVTDGTLSVNKINLDKIDGLNDALSALNQRKVDAITSDYNGNQVAWTLLSPENQAKLAALTLEGNDIQLSGKVNAENVEGLSSYIITNRDSIDGLLSVADQEKLSSITAGAQANIIESVSLGNEPLIVSPDKSVNIPIASINTLGVVLGSTAENKVSVGDDGNMEVNSLNVNKLVQTDGDTLVLNGGNSTV